VYLKIPCADQEEYIFIFNKVLREDITTFLYWKRGCYIASDLFYSAKQPVTM